MLPAGVAPEAAMLPAGVTSAEIQQALDIPVSYTHLGALLLWLPAVNGKPQHFHHFPGNQVPAFFGDLALLVVEARFGQ